MSSATTHSLSRDALRALRGVVRIIRFDPLWAEDFDLDRLGFVRSFFAQFLRLPFLLLFSAVLSHAVKEKVTALTLAERAGAALAGVVAYAFVSLVAARLLKPVSYTHLTLPTNREV